MTNNQISHWLAACAGSTDPAVIEAHAIISYLAGPDGAIGIADAAAWELISCECYTGGLDGEMWWRTHPDEIDLFQTEEEESIAGQVATALRYLGRRQLLKFHPHHPTFVRPLA